MLTCGVDIGARSIKMALLDGSRILASRTFSSGPTPRETAESAFAELLRGAGIGRADVGRVIATGYGRRHSKAADATASEISCHAAGVRHVFPDALGMVDIGGQDSKAIRLRPDGRVAEFVMNDRCAAGTGRFIEMVAQTLGIAVEDAGPLSLAGGDACEISSMCAVFAESEIVGLLHAGTHPGTVLRGVFRSVARRTVSLLVSAGITGEVVFTGGVARNVGVIRALEAELGQALRVPSDPQLTGALGAAILAGRPASIEKEDC